MKQIVLCVVLLFCGVQGAEKEMVEPSSSDDAYIRQYPIHSAIRRCKSVLLVQENLLSNLKDINQPDPSGLTPLWYACDIGSVPVVELLLQNKASVHVQVPDYEKDKDSYIGLLPFAVRRANDCLKKGARQVYGVHEYGPAYGQCARVAALLKAHGAQLIVDIPLSDQRDVVALGAQFLASDRNAGDARSASVSAGDEKKS